MSGAVEPLFQVEGLKKYFPVYGGALLRRVGSVKAVDGIDFEVRRGEVFGLVGESGSGKSTVGRMMTALIKPTAGIIRYKGKSDVTQLRGEELRVFRREVQIVFQDPFSSLNPRMTVGQIVADPLIVNGICPRNEIRARVESLLELVGLDPRLVRKYPHEFGGGDRQRVGIATALAVNPIFLFCDEPVSALDLSAEAQILNLLKELRDRLQLTLLVVAHNLSVVEYVSDRVGVMYLGKIVEVADTDELYNHPRHPYTQALISAVPIPDPRVARGRAEIVLTGEIPSPLRPPQGCRFHTRCQAERTGPCYKEEPPLVDIGGGHRVACHLYA